MYSAWYPGCSDIGGSRGRSYANVCVWSWWNRMQGNIPDCWWIQDTLINWKCVCQWSAILGDWELSSSWMPHPMKDWWTALIQLIANSNDSIGFGTWGPDTPQVVHSTKTHIGCQNFWWAVLLQVLQSYLEIGQRDSDEIGVTIGVWACLDCLLTSYDYGTRCVTAY